jgi:hypothetical protein
MMGRLLATGLTALLCALVAGPGTGRAAEDPLEGDLRDLRVGTAVDQLPAEGYVDLACGKNGGAPGAALARWAEFARRMPQGCTRSFLPTPLRRSPRSANAGRGPRSPAIR